MTEPESQRSKLDGRQIVGPEPLDSTPPHRRRWRRLGIYGSNICVAVYLSPRITDPITDAVEDEAKRSLFSYLRQVHLATLESGGIYPVAGVIVAAHKSAPLVKKMQAWTSDQNWHRGGFALYVVGSEKEAEDRLVDLLDPTVEDLVYENKEDPRGLEWFAEKMREAARGWDNRLAKELAEICAERFLEKEQRMGEEKQRMGDENFPSLKEWQDRQVNEARRLAKDNV